MSTAAAAAATETPSTEAAPPASFQLPKDDAEALALLRDPPPDVSLWCIVAGLLDEGRGDVVQCAVHDGVLPPDFEASDGAPLVFAAAWRGAALLIKYLVKERRVDPNAALDGHSGLYAAIYHKHEAAALWLINEAPGIDVDARVPTRNNHTMLSAAAAIGMLAVVQALVGKGADVEACDDKGKTAMCYALWNERQDIALYLLEECGAAWKGSDWNALQMAAARGMERMIKAIVGRLRAQAQEQGQGEETIWEAMAEAASGALTHAPTGTSVRAGLKALVDEGLDVTRVGAPVTCECCSHAWQPLFHLAAHHGNVETAAFLLECGCDPLWLDTVGTLPLHLAAAAGQLSMVQWLLTLPGLHVDTTDAGERCRPPTGPTALMMAAGNNKRDVAEWLVEQGADPLKMLRRTDGMTLTAADLAEEKGHTELAAYLRGQERTFQARRRQTGQERKEAAAREEEEAAARRARNEKRRQKMKKAKARRAAAEAAAAGDGADGQLEGDGDEDEAEEAEQLASGVAGLAVAGGAGGGDEKKEAAPLDAPVIARPAPLADFLDAHTPEWLVCPITLQLLDDPVLLVADGCTYSRAAIEHHLARCRERGLPLTSPTTNLEIDPADARVAPNVMARSKALEYKEAKTREWEAAERRWRESVEAQEQQQEQQA